MDEKIEKIANISFNKWKAANQEQGDIHPEEEVLACFIEEKLANKENELLKEHLLKCSRCAEIITTQIRMKPLEEKEVPPELIESTKVLVMNQLPSNILEVLLKFKGTALELLNTTGYVLSGQEFVPAAVLRSRQIKDFKDEIAIFKDFKDIRAELKIENERGEAFTLTIVVKDKNTQSLIKDIRITLLKDELELESYLTDSGKVCFEHVLLGKYTVEIATINDRLASILLDIKI